MYVLMYSPAVLTVVYENVHLLLASSRLYWASLLQVTVTSTAMR